jgi:uncharacterized protein involved in exopolysaccharide biosynthesis
MSEQIQTDEITLKELITKGMEWFRYFKSKWKMIALGGVVGALIGFVIAYIDKPTYTAELTLALEEKSTGSSYAGLASQFGIDLGGAGGGAFSGENTIELMKSRNIIEKALLTAVEIDGQKELLINRYIEFNKWREKWETKRPDLAAIRYVENENRSTFGIKKDSILYAVYKTIKKSNLTVEKIDKKLSIIKVTVKSKDELFAKYFTEILVGAASNLYIQTKTQKSKRNVDILEAKLDSVKTELDKNIYGAASSRDQNLNVIRAKGNVTSSKQQLNIQILTTMYGELVKNTEMAKYSLMREEPFIQIIDSPILPLDKTKRSKLVGLILGNVTGCLLVLCVLIISRLKTRFVNEIKF